MSNTSSCLPLRSLNHISRVCKDVEASARFYEHVLGFYRIKRPTSFDFDGHWLFNYNLGIHLIAGEPVERPRELNPRADHMSFQADNLVEVEARLKALGIPTVKASVEENGVMVTQVFFTDPDGNMIEICDCDCLPIQPLSGPAVLQAASCRSSSSCGTTLAPSGSSSESFCSPPSVGSFPASRRVS